MLPTHLDSSTDFTFVACDSAEELQEQLRLFANTLKGGVTVFALVAAQGRWVAWLKRDKEQTPEAPKPKASVTKQKK